MPGSFTILGVSRPEGKVVFPSERTYQNIRILDKSTYDFVTACQVPCVQTFALVTPVVASVRPAQTRKQMWIVQVDFNHAWLITFLVFKKGEDYSIKLPEHFKFLSSSLAQQTHEVILQALRQENI